MNEEYLYSIGQQLWYVPEDVAELYFVKVLEVSIEIIQSTSINYYILNKGKTLRVPESRLFPTEISARQEIQNILE